MKKDEILKIQRQTIKIDLGIQEIRKELTFIKIKQHNDNEKNEEAISQQPEDTRVMEICFQQVKSTYNRQNQMLMSSSSTIETHDLKLKSSSKG